MTIGDDLISVEDTARALDISVQHVRRLAGSGQLAKVARGQLDRLSVERYRLEHPQSRTRAWAEATAWGAIAMLDRQDADWLGATQASRVRRTLRDLAEPADLLSRVRDRARVLTFRAHSSALPRLRGMLVVADLSKLGLVDVGRDQIDGYLTAQALDSTVRSLGLREDPSGKATVRATSFDFGVVGTLVTTGVVAAALDAATSLDPRTRGVGERALAKALDAYR